MRGEHPSCSEIRLITHTAFAKANQYRRRRFLHRTAARSEFTRAAIPVRKSSNTTLSLSLSLSLSTSLAGSNPFPFFAQTFWWRVSPPPSLPSSPSSDSLSAQRSFHLCFVWQHFKLSVAEPPLVETFENASRKRKAESQIAAKTSVAVPCLLLKKRHRLQTLMATFQQSPVSLARASQPHPQQFDPPTMKSAEINISGGRKREQHPLSTASIHSSTSREG